MKIVLFIILAMLSSKSFAANYNFEFTATSLETNITWYSLYCNNDDGSYTHIKGSGLNVIVIPGATLCNKYSMIVMNQAGLWSEHSNVVDVTELRDTPVPTPKPTVTPVPTTTPKPSPTPTPKPTPVATTPAPKLPAPKITVKILPLINGK